MTELLSNLVFEGCCVDFHAEVSRVFHREVSHLKVMAFGSGWRQGMTDLLLFSGRCCRASLKAKAVVAGFHDVAAMGEAVQQSGGHFGIAEHRGPFAEAEVGGYCHACALVKLAQEMEEQRAARGAEWQVSQFIEDHEVEPGETFGELPGLAFGLFLLERVYQFNGREEADLLAVVLDGLDGQSRRDMGFAGAWAAYQHHILGTIQEVTTVQLAHGRLIDLAGGEVEAGEILVGQKSCGLDVVGPSRRCKLRLPGNGSNAPLVRLVQPLAIGTGWARPRRKLAMPVPPVR